MTNMTSDSNPLTETIARLAIVILVAASLGCEEPSVRYPVAGKVLIDGQPLQIGSIRFVPKSGRPFTSTIMEDGSFELSENAISTSQEQLGVFPGTYQVAVSASKVIDEASNDVEWLAPSKYADFRTSGIEVQIMGPKEDMQIDLTWKGDEQSDDASASDAEAKLKGNADSEQSSKESTSDAPQEEEAPKNK